MSGSTSAENEIDSLISEENSDVLAKFIQRSKFFQRRSMFDCLLDKYRRKLYHERSAALREHIAFRGGVRPGKTVLTFKPRQALVEYKKAKAE